MFALIIDSGADDSQAAPMAVEQNKQAARFESFQQGVCGQVITGSVTLTQDISSCEGDGIIIGADYVALDGDGHTIRKNLITGNRRGISFRNPYFCLRGNSLRRTSSGRTRLTSLTGS